MRVQSIQWSAPGIQPPNECTDSLLASQQLDELDALRAQLAVLARSSPAAAQLLSILLRRR